MIKLKRISDGKVFDGTIVLFQNNSRVNIMTAVYYEYCEWKMSPLYEFMPAAEGVDY